MEWRKPNPGETRTARQTIEAVLDTLPDSYFEADLHGLITYANRAFYDNLRYPDRASVIGRHFSRFTDRNSLGTLSERFRRMRKTGMPVPPFEYDYRRSDGVVRPAEASISPMLENGRVVGTRGILRDIGDRRETASMLVKAHEAADQRAIQMAAVNRIAATVSRSLDLNDVLKSVCRELTGVFPVRNAGVALLTPDRGNLRVVAFHSVIPDEPSALGIVLPFTGNTSSEEVIATGRTLVIQDAQTDPRTSSLADLSRARGTRALMIVPILARGEAIGTIGMPALDPAYVFTDTEITLAETIASQIAPAVENAQLFARTERALGAAERDLEIGRQIQSGFFPERLPELAGWEFAAQFHAARQVAGDFYDVFRFRKSELTAIIIADVCDKGVGAALFMVLICSLLRAFSETDISPATAATQLQSIVLKTNNFVVDYHGRSSMFATLFFGVLDPQSGQLHYVNAGHEPPVLLDRDGTITHRLMPTGPAVGLFCDLDFRVGSVCLDLGDSLVGFTDGIMDAKNRFGELYTEERLLETIAVPWTSVFSMLYELDLSLQNHIGDKPQFDDITTVAVRRAAADRPPVHAMCREASLEAVAELRHFVGQAARHAGLGEEDVFAARMCSAERLARAETQRIHEHSDASRRR